MRRRKSLILALTAVCCTIMAGVFGVRTLAASGNAPVGNLSAGDGRFVFCSEDITYLAGELAALQSKIEDAVPDDGCADVVVSVSENKVRGKMKSCGIINYDNGKVVINAANLLALADETDALTDTCAASVCHALNHIGTYFDTDGNINYESQTSEPIVMNFEQLMEGIRRSQSVDHLSAAPVTANNITAGAAVWVNGYCIIGNGKDNQEAYLRGMADGAAGEGEGVEIRQTNHVHTGNGQSGWDDNYVFSQNDSPGGCFTDGCHEHDDCPVILAGMKEISRYEGSTAVISQHQCLYCGAIHRHEGASSGDIPHPDTCRHEHETCGDLPVNRWAVSCGKIAGQPETATIIIN